MSSSSGGEDTSQDLHLDVIVVPSLENGNVSDDHTPASSKNFSSVLDACLPGYATRINFEYGPGDVIQGHNSRDAVGTLALKLLSQLQSHRKCSPDSPPPIIWVGHELGGMIIKEAIAIAALDRNQHQDIIDSTELFIFLDCIHFTATQFEIVNKVAQWISRATEPQSPVLLQSIDTLGASVSEINETFLETKLPQYTETISIRSLESFPSMNSAKFNGTLGIIREKFLEITDDDSREKAKEVLNKAIIKAAKAFQSHRNAWLQILQFLSTPSRVLLNHSVPRDSALNWILEDDVYIKWRQTKGSMAVQLHGSRSSDALQFFCANETNMIEDNQTLVVHFTFDRHDDRRNSALAMATSLIAQIATSSEEDIFAGKMFSRKWFLRAWTLFDALYILQELSYDTEIVFVLQAFDHCDSNSRQPCLDMFKRIILFRDSKARLLVTSDKNMSAEWVGESLTPGQKPPASPHQLLDRVLNLEVGEVLHIGTTSTHSLGEDDTRENRETSKFDNGENQALTQHLKMRFIDAGFPEVSAQDLIHLVLNAGDTDLRDVLLLKLKSPATIPPLESLFSLANSQSLDEMFRKILGGVQESEKQLIRHILSWVLFSVRPLSIQELSAVVLWEKQGDVLDNSTNTKGRNSRLISPIVDMLWGILLIDQNEVRLIHPAARELLSRPGTEWFHVEQNAHLHIVLSCLDFLSREEFVACMEEIRGSECNLEGQNVLVSRSTFENRTTLHQYIITKWPEHYRQIPASYRPKDEVVSFFKKNSGRVWQSWARSKWIVSNPINRSAREEIFSKSALPFITEIGDLELLKCWEKVSGDQNLEDIGNALEEASRMGAREIVDHLLNHGVAEASHLQAALTAAASSAESEVLMTLISAAPEGFDWPASLLICVSDLGFEDCVRALLTRGCNPNTRAKNLDTTALMRAARMGNAQICDLLLQHNANPNDLDLEGTSVITAAANCAMGADVIKTLVAHKIDVMAKDKSGDSALGESSRLGHFEVSRALVNVIKDSEQTPSFEEIEKWLQWTAGDNFCRTAVPLLDLLRVGPSSQILKRQLRNALEWGRPQFVRLLIEECKDLLSPLEAADDEFPWLSEVCNSPDADLDLMKLLVEAGAEVDPETEGPSPLKSAARKGRLDFVKFLIEHGAQINKDKSTKMPALSEAARSGNLECVRYLLESGAELEWKDNYGEAAIFEAAEGRHFDVVNFLLDQGTAVSGKGFKGRTLPILCISSASTLRRILERGSEIDTRDDSGWAPIHYAAAEGHDDAISVLAEFKAELNLETSERPDDEVTPLIRAVANKHHKSIEVLIEAGASVDYAVTQSRYTAILDAATPEVIDILLQYSPDVNAANSHGLTALHMRTNDQSPKISVIKRLVNARANVNVVCKDGCCLPLVNLAWNVDHWPIMEYLISKNADINMTTPLNGSALHRACTLDNLQLVTLLHQAGAKADVAVDRIAGTPLQSACRSHLGDDNGLGVIRYLIEEAEADVNQLCGPFGTALSVACQRASSKALELLLDHGAAWDIPDQVGRLPVHFAALHMPDGFDHLVKNGCDVHAVDKTGRTVLQWAAQSGNVEMVEKILLRPDVQVDLQDKDGWTALCWAARGITSTDGRPSNQSTEAQADIIKLLLKHGANKTLQVRGDSDQTWTLLQIATFHDSGEIVRKLLIDKPEDTATNDRKKRSILRKGHRKGIEGTAYCDSCLSFLTGTAHSCKSCSDFDFCFKCISHREEIHDPTHEFEAEGPIFEESDPLEDEPSDSESTSSEASIALDLE
ncbi:ankyrin repeat-containing domain protein [Pestalotiopsis sp. NC0098]|nr:ankyrin repeat-containing domain protein [Pestalotiopsis sp. NC0098]